MSDKSHQEYYVRQLREKTPDDSGLRMLPDIAGCTTYGMKGTVSEMEGSVLRQRSHDARRQKAERGELFLNLPAGYVKVGRDAIAMDPDQRVRDAIRHVFRKFAEFRSIRQVFLWTAYAHGSGCESLPPDVEVEVRAGERVECSSYVPADGATT